MKDNILKMSSQNFNRRFDNNILVVNSQGKNKNEWRRSPDLRHLLFVLI